MNTVLQNVETKKQELLSEKANIALERFLLLLKVIGKTNKLSNREMTRMLGLSHSAIYDWKKGKFPGLDKLVFVAECFGLTLAELGYLLTDSNLTEKKVKQFVLNKNLLNKNTHRALNKSQEDKIINVPVVLSLTVKSGASGIIPEVSVELPNNL